MAKILMVGLGDLGGRLAALLAGQGHQVWGLRRSAGAPAGVQLVQGDVTRPDTLLLPAGVDYVFVILSPGESTDAAYERVYVQGLKNLLSHMDTSGLKRLFFVSSTSVYGQDHGEWVDETSPARPSSFAGRRLLEAENLLENQSFSSTVVRFAGIYGPGRLRLLRWVASGRPVQEAPPVWTNRIHIEDCITLLAHLLARDLQGDTVEALYLGVDDEPVPLHVVLDWLAQQMGSPCLPRDDSGAAGQNKRLSNARSRRSGFSYLHPDFRSGYRGVTRPVDEFR